MNLIKLVVLLASTLLLQSAHAGGDPAAGESKAMVCSACHGPDGNSLVPMYPSLAGQGEGYLVKQLRDYKSGARANPIMAPQAVGLSEQDMQDLAAFFAGQSRKQGEADPELVEKGQRLYMGGNASSGVSACAGCHGPAGEGIEAATFPSLAGQHAQYTEDQLRAFRAAGRDDLDAAAYRRNDSDDESVGMMQSIAARMTDREIRAVASYIQGLGRQPR